MRAVRTASLALSWATLAAPAPAADAPPARPNILFVVSDDQRADTIGALGNPVIRTPTLDRLVQSGTAFPRAYIMGAMQGAVCVPSRAMIHSGRSLFRVPESLPPDVPLLAETFKKAGYATCGVGKWHNGGPSFARGFGTGGPLFFGGMSNQSKVPVQDFDPDGRYEKSRQRVGDAFSTDLFADGAARFLREYKDAAPFLLYLAFTVPHDPRTPPPDAAVLYAAADMPLPPNALPVHPFNNGEMTVRDEKLLPWPRSPDAVRREIAAYYGMITHMDAQIGRLLKILEETGRADRTIVVFAGDNGLALGSHGLLGKQNLYEHSVRVPLLMAGPGVPKGFRSETFCYLYDIFPTLCRLADVPIPAGVEGFVLFPSEAGRPAKGREAVFTAYRNVQRAVRTDRWKLIRYTQINKTQLFDLADDPFETKDLADDPAQAGRVQEMMGLLAKEQKRYGDAQPLTSDRPAPSTFEPPK